MKLWNFFLFLLIGFAVPVLLNFVRAATVSSTVVTTVQPGLTQLDYRWYSNENALTPTSAQASENTSIETPATGSVLRLRMNLAAGADFASGLTFKLQYSTSTSGGFGDLSTSTPWIFYDNSSVADGQIILTTVLGSSNVGESYGESNPSAASPVGILNGQSAEWDWVLRNNSADTASDWYFRMIFSSGTVLDAYGNYSKLKAATPSSQGGGSPSVILPGGGPSGPGVSSTKLQEMLPSEIESPCDNIAIQQVDLSGDCRVDIIDLSILLYYYGRSGSEISRYDFNNNNTVDFPDISVLMFHWMS